MEMHPNSLEYPGKQRPEQVFSLPAAGGVNYFRGRMLAVALATGLAAIPADSPGLMVLGRVEKSVYNEHGANGDQVVSYHLGTFTFTNSVTHPVTQAWYGKPVFVEDDVTVSILPGNNNVFAGICCGFGDLNPNDVWVDTRPLPILAPLFLSGPNNNFRLSLNGDGSATFQLWNQTQNAYQTVQLAGAANAEHLLIAAAS